MRVFAGKRGGADDARCDSIYDRRHDPSRCPAAERASRQFTSAEKGLTILPAGRRLARIAQPVVPVSQVIRVGAGGGSTKMFWTGYRCGFIACHRPEDCDARLWGIHWGPLRRGGLPCISPARR